jgi:hypothetical protein
MKLKNELLSLVETQGRGSEGGEGRAFGLLYLQNDVLYKIYTTRVARDGRDVLHHQLGGLGLTGSRLATADIYGYFSLRSSRRWGAEWGPTSREQTNVRDNDTLVDVLRLDAAVGRLGEGVHVGRLLVLIAPPVRVQALIREESVDPSEGIDRDQHGTNVGLQEKCVERDKSGLAQ